MFILFEGEKYLLIFIDDFLYDGIGGNYNFLFEIKTEPKEKNLEAP